MLRVVRLAAKMNNGASHVSLCEEQVSAQHLDLKVGPPRQ
jgi:hypothetical protein